MSRRNLVCSHLSLLQADRAPGWNEEGSPEYRKYMKTLEFGKVAFPREVVNKLPGASLICKDGIMDDHFALSGKLEVLDKLLTKYKEENSRALLFSYSTKTLDLIQNYVRSVGYSFDRMDGKTANTRRQEIADKFNKDPSIFLLLLSTKAMGVGLNLTVRFSILASTLGCILLLSTCTFQHFLLMQAANRVIIFDVEWNPSWDEQAQGKRKFKTVVQC